MSPNLTPKGRLWLLPTLAISALAMTPAATASDKVPPRATLHADGHVQRGHRYVSSWTRPSGPGECVTAAADGLLRFGAPLHVGSGRRTIRIRFHKSQRPEDRLSIEAWKELDSNGEPLGEPKVLPYQLLRESHRRHSRWSARVRPVVSSDLYLSVFARWRDTDGCGGIQDAAWSFHLAP